MAKKQTAVKKPAKAAKTPTAKVLRQEIAADVAKEAALTRKHEVGQARAVAKKVASLKHELAAKTKKRGLALAPGDVECCAAQAVAETLRLAGGTVSDEDVLGLHWAAGGSTDRGVPILAVLETAKRRGLAGTRSAGFGPLDILGDPWQVLDAGLPSLILGLAVPGGSHTVTDDGVSWWSWGEPLSLAAFPGAVIEEAWAVTW